MPEPFRSTTIVLAALAAALVAAVGVPAAQASPSSLEQATSSCWLDVINDWLDNNRVDNTYAIPCYTQAIQHLTSLPDVTGYSSAIDDIHRALLAAIHEEHNTGGPSGGGPSGGGSTSGGPSGGHPGGGGGNGNTPGGGTPASSSNGPLTGLGSPSSATSIPLPLIVLGALAILLALAALGTWLARRFQGRRPPPAPAVSRRR